MSKHILLIAGTSLLVLSAGCASVTRITSTPDGATIMLNGNYVGETPVSCKVREPVLPFATYTFNATKHGYRADSKIIHETKLFDHPGTAVPPHIHFDLEPAD